MKVARTNGTPIPCSRTVRRSAGFFLCSPGGEMRGGMMMPDGGGTSRRSFLKIGGAAAVISSLEPAAEADRKPSIRHSKSRRGFGRVAASGGRRSAGGPGQSSSGDRFHFTVFAREYFADCCGSFRNGALGAAVEQPQCVVLSASRSATGRHPLHSPTERLAWRLWPCDFHAFQRRSVAGGFCACVELPAGRTDDFALFSEAASYPLSLLS